LAAEGAGDEIELCFCRGGKLLFARNFVLAAAADEEVGRQLQLTLSAFQREFPGRQVERVILTGRDHNAAAFREQLSKILPVPLQESAGQDGTLNSFWGLAQMPDPAPDLMPSSVKESKFARHRQAALLRAGAGAALAIGVAGLAVGLNLRAHTRELTDIRQRLAVNRNAVKEAQEQIEFFRLFEESKSNQVVIAELIRELYDIIPEQTLINSLKLGGGDLSIQGQTGIRTDVNIIQQGMMDSALFKDVTLQYANHSGQLGMTEFRISCRLRTGTGEKERP
jgi:hypothetical protein